MSLNDFIHKNILKNEATSNMKIYRMLLSLSLSDVGNFLKDVPFKFDTGVVNLNPLRGTHWVVYLNLDYFDSYGCPPPKNFPVL